MYLHHHGGCIEHHQHKVTHTNNIISWSRLTTLSRTPCKYLHTGSHVGLINLKNLKMLGPASPSNTGYNGDPSAALVSPGSGSRNTHARGGRGGGRGGIPRQRTPPRNYNFSPNYNPPHLNNSPPNGDSSDAPPPRHPFYRNEAYARLRHSLSTQGIQNPPAR